MKRTHPEMNCYTCPPGGGEAWRQHPTASSPPQRSGIHPGGALSRLRTNFYYGNPLTLQSTLTSILVTNERNSLTLVPRLPVSQHVPSDAKRGLGELLALLDDRSPGAAALGCSEEKARTILNYRTVTPHATRSPFHLSPHHSWSQTQKITSQLSSQIGN